MRTFWRTIIVIGILYVAFTPVLAFAQGADGFDIFPIVTCGTQAAGEAGACTPCGLFDIAENAVKFVAIGVTGPVAALMFIYAGFLFLFYGANVSMAARAKTVMTNTVYGVAIILMSWIIVVQLIKTVAPESRQADRWYEFNCPQFLGGIGQAENLQNPEPGRTDVFTDLPDVLSCDEGDFGELAQIFNTNSDPQAVSPDLQELIDCLLEDPVINAAHDPTQLFTFEVNNPACNIVRGFRNCGTCQHSLFSCHYGGGNGSEGAQAVDFNFKGQLSGEAVVVTDPETGITIIVRDEKELARELVRAANENQCNFKLLKFEGSHTHISTLACDSDGRTTDIQGITPADLIEGVIRTFLP